MKNISPPLRDQRGARPPVVVTCHSVAPEFGNGTTYTSNRPLSFDAYAMNLPSGEMLGEYSEREDATIGTSFSCKAVAGRQRCRPLPRRCRPVEQDDFDA